MADNHKALAAARDLVRPKYANAFDSAQLVGTAINAGEDMLRALMRKHPYALLAGSLAIGAAVGLIALVAPRPEPVPVRRQRRWW